MATATCALLVYLDAPELSICSLRAACPLVHSVELCLVHEPVESHLVSVGLVLCILSQLHLLVLDDIVHEFFLLGSVLDMPVYPCF